jgi:tetratricopeptide (TPR) repeat protein
MAVTRRHLNLLMPAAVFLASLALYLPTLNPAFRADDSPETITAAVTLGIQHPPAYPLQTLLGRLASLVPLGAAAWRLNLLAAFWGALACALLAILTQSLAMEALAGRREQAPEALAALAGACAGITWAASGTFWSQSLAAKGGIYTLHMVLVTSALLALWAWVQRARSAPDLSCAALLAMPPARLAVFLLALGLGNHWETQALLMPAVAALVFCVLWPRRAISAGPAAWSGALASLALLAALGLSPLLYLPLRARLEPALNWGNPSSWQQFWWVLQRQEYLDLETGFLKSLRSAVFTGGPWSDVSANWQVVQLQGLRVIAHTLGPKPDLGMALVLLGLLGWPLLKPGRRPWADSSLAKFGLATALMILVFVGGVTFYFHLKEQMVWILDVFLLPVYLAQALLAGMGLLWLALRLGPVPRRRLAPWALLLALTAFPCSLYALRAAALTQARQFLAWDFAHDLLLSLKRNAIVLAEGDFFTMPVYYVQTVQGERPDVDHITTVFLSTDWGVAHVRALQPRLGIGAVPKAVTGERAGDAQVLRAALSQIVQANPGRPLQVSLFRQVLDQTVPEWTARWRPMGLAEELDGKSTPEEDRRRMGLLTAFRTRHFELDRETLDPSPAFALSNYGSAFMDLAAYLRGLGRVREALDLYARAAQWTSRANLAETYTFWGIAVESGGGGIAPDLPQAAVLFKKALAVRPIFEAWVNLAGVDNTLGQSTRQTPYFVDAESAARQALALVPENPQAWNNLAVALNGQGRAPEALQALRTAAAYDPENRQIQANLKAISARH